MYVFGELLKGFRQREGLTQQELAVRLGVHRRSISDWERSAYLPGTREMVLDLAEALGLSPADTDHLLIAAQYLAEYTLPSQAISIAFPRAAFVVPFQAPPLPTHFIPRPEVSDAIKMAILAANGVPGILVVGAIQGLGGIGKSVLATALAHDPQVCALFPDGVLWATLGQEPETLSLLTSWLRDGLGDYDYQPLRIDDASLHLRMLLRDKACLLVVDDVWQSAAVQPFLAGGPQCRALVTTRRVDVADALGASLFPLDVMTEEQALALLGARLGRSLAGRERAEALRVVRAVGNLPLALELAAVRVGRGVTWGELGAALEAEIVHLETLDSVRDRRGQPRLDAAFRLSLDALYAENLGVWQAFVWLGVLPEDAAVAAPATATLWEVAVAEADDLLEVLWSDALLMTGSPISVGGRRWRSYRMHDLLRTVARRLMEAAPPRGLGLTLSRAHATMVDRYRAVCRRKALLGASTALELPPWHILPDDGYIHDHLVWHLAQAGCDTEIHALLREETPRGRNGWYEARERLGQTGGYMADVRHAWQLAESQATCAGRQGLACRYALILASLNSLAGNIPPDLLSALVGEGIWTVSQGLAYARQMLDPRQRADALEGLVPHLPRSQQAGVQGEVLATAQAMANEYYRADALARLGPYLPERLLGEALAAARAIKDENARGRALARLGPHLPEGLQAEVLGEALTAVRTMEHGHARIEALEWLAPHLPEKLLEEALAAAREMKYETDRARALVKLGPYLPEKLLREAFVSARAFTDKKARAEALAGLGPYLPEKLLTEALAAARAIRDKEARAEALAGIGPHLPARQRSGVLREALAATRSIRERWARAPMLVRLGPYLSEELLGKALTMAQAIDSGRHRAQALEGLAPHLPEKLLGKALDVACAIEYELDRAMALAKMAPHLPSALLEKALAVAWVIEDEAARGQALAGLAAYVAASHRAVVISEALAAARATPEAEVPTFILKWLAPHLTEGLLAEALVVAQDVRDEGARTWALELLMPYLPARLLPTALTAVVALGNKWTSARALASVGQRLPSVQRAEALLQALDFARAIQDEEARAQVLAGLGPYLPEDLLEEALGAVQAIQHEETRARVLVQMAPRLPEELLPKALSIAWAIENHWARERALAGLRPYLSAEEALATAKAIRYLVSRAQALAELGTLLPEGELAAVMVEALDTVPASWIEERVQALRKLGSYLPEPLRSEALQETLVAARATKDEGSKARALAALAWLMPEDQQATLREEALSLARAKLSKDMQSSILMVLARQMPEDQRADVAREGLAAARGIENETRRSERLIELAPYLPEPLRSDAFREALAGVQAIPAGRVRAEMMARLGPGLSEELLEDALALALAIEDTEKRALALVGLGKAMVELPQVSLSRLWDKFLGELGARTRRDLLSDLWALTPAFVALGGESTAVETFHAIQDVGRWWP